MNKKSLNAVYNVDARNILDTISPEIKITTTITSPPYYDMKDYDSENQIGYGQNYDEYLSDLKYIFRGVYEITESNGTLWIIIDTLKRDNQVVTLPFDLSNELKEIGWLLQDIIIWKKDKTVPWSTNGFMQRKFEYILFFSKNKKFKSHKDKVRIYDTSRLKKWWIKYPERYNPKGKALDEIWEFPIPTQGSWGEKYIRHFCPLPQKMVATMIQISTDEKDNILDPFAGSGTVLSQSAYMKRNFIGFELNQKYIVMFKNYLKKTFDKYRREYELYTLDNDQNKFEKQILDLRSLKYARVLLKSIEENCKIMNFKIFVTPKNASKLKTKLLQVEYQIIGEFDREVFLNEAKKLSNKAPLSKFGIEPVFKFLKFKKFNNKAHFGYTKANTSLFVKHSDLNSSKIRVVSRICADINENDYL